MSNFDFLEGFDNTLWKLGNRIEMNVTVSPSGVKADATTFLEHLIKKLMIKAGLNPNSTKYFAEKVDAVFRSDLKISNMYCNRLKSAYNYRSKIHDEFEEIEKHEFQDAAILHEKLFHIAKKYYRDYNDDYDEYKGVPDFKPLQLDFSEDHVKPRDFNEIIDVKYDYCVVCGEPNHLNYSIYCHKCSSELDNANNFISIRNAFGKNSQFSKDDLIEYGMSEGYINQFLNSLVRQDMLKAAGRFYTFKNMHLEEYLKKIDNYIAVGELITRFKEDKISPEDIRKSREYILGSRKEEPFYQFYKITNREIIKKFEKDLLTTEDIHDSISYTTITDKELKRWYDIRLGEYKKGQINESFVKFNELLIRDFLDLKRGGILEGEIKEKLNVTDEMYAFWTRFDDTFAESLNEIKIELLSKAISEGKTRDEVIEYAGVTPKEYDNLVKVSSFNDDEFAHLRNAEIELRKKNFLNYLKNNDLESSCRLAKFTINDFYQYYDTASVSSDFYIQSTQMLMDKYLAQRRLGKTRAEVIVEVGIKEKYVNRWLKRSQYSSFKDEDLKITVNLILRGLKQKKSFDEIAKTVEVSVNTIKRDIMLGEKGSKFFKPLYDFYVENIIPEKLDKFLHGTEKRSVRRALDSANLSQEELDKYYQLGKSGDERFKQFYEEFLEYKKGIYVRQISKGKSHKIAMRESFLSEDEYSALKDELEDNSRLKKFHIVLKTIDDDKKSNVAASKAGCSVEEIYEWYFKGKEGEKEYVEFYEHFHNSYVRPNIVPIQKMLDSENVNIDILIKSNKDKFTKKDFDIWVKHGLIKIGVVHIDNDDEDEDDEDEKTTKKIKLNVLNINNKRSSLGRAEGVDIEDLKKQILGE